MRPTRGTVFVLGGGLLAAWLAAAAGVRRGGPSAPEPVHPAAGPVALSAEAVQEPTARLAERLRVRPAPPQPVRNPFTFATPVVPVPGVAQTRSDEGERPEIVPADPLLLLVGIAEDDEAGQTRRTAVIRAADELYLVHMGEAVASHYRVVAIDAEAVALVDEDTGTVVTLVLP